MTVFETDRLLLRHLVPTDLDDLYALYRDPEVRRYFPEGTLTRDETREELEWFLQGHPRHPELGLWATIERATGAFIGRAGLLPWTIDGCLEVEIAYLIARDRWRQGLGAEVARGLVRYGFGTLKLPRLIALIDPENLASQRTAQAAGLTLERDLVMEDGVYTHLYACTRPSSH